MTMIGRRQFTKGLVLTAGLASFGRAKPAAAGEAVTCTLIEEAASGRRLVRQGPCEQRFSPFSTFKIAIAVMGYDAGILVDAHHPAWEYRPEFMASADRDKKTVDPTIWERDSVVWYSQEVTRRLGMERFRHFVQQLDYGNRDVSGTPGQDDGLTRAWLNASLQISPEEEVAFLRKLLAGTLPVAPQAMERTAAILPVFAASGGWTVHGKTGSGWLRDSVGGIDENRPQGWFVGWAEKDGRQLIFARLEIGDEKLPGFAGIKARDAVLADFAGLVAEP